MEESGGYDFNTMSEEKEQDAVPLEEKKGLEIKLILMIIFGIVSLFTSPVFVVFLGILSGRVYFIMIFVSLGFAGASGYLGERLIKKSNKLGWIGIGFMAFAILLVLGPIILAFIFI